MSFFSKISSPSKNNNSKRNGVVGIDIGSSSIKVVELQDRKGVATLTTYGELQLGPYSGKFVGESVFLDQQQEQEALVDVIRESAVKVKQAVFTMPLSASFVTNVSLEVDANTTDLYPLVQVEARKVIPVPLNEVTLDWAEVDSIKKGSDDKGVTRRNVLVAAIQNSSLERFKVLMQFTGFSQPPTEIECFSTIRALYDSNESDIAIIDIGATSSKLYIVRKGLLVRMYRLRAGGELATKKIAEYLNVSFEEAEALKYSADKQSDNFSDLKKAHNSSYDRAFREFNQVLREYQSKTGNTPTVVHLSGGGASFPGIDQYLKNALEKEVILANPFSKVAYPAFMEDTIHQIGPSFTVALGAAIRAF